jgi:ribulose-phosphate 3-epimerase
LFHYVYRFRYLACFTLIGLLSILLELAVLQLLPEWWPFAGQVSVAFAVGMALSLVLNVTVNFHVPRQYLLRTSAWFVAISIASFLLNSAVVHFLHATTDIAYSLLRLGISGLLFILAYTLHRTFTFDQSRNFGIAVYASENEDVKRVFDLVGHHCDHVHVDLVDDTILPSAARVRLDRIDEVRRFWSGYPVCLHVMSRLPRRWCEKTWDQVDWYLLPCNADDDVMELIFECRLRNKKVGVVWHAEAAVGDLMPYLPHVDFVMVLGIAQPGKSGQTLSERGLEVAQTLERMRPLYHYDLMFDGGVKAHNAAQIPGKYIVSASGVLNAARPTAAAHILRLSRYRPERFRDAA